MKKKWIAVMQTGLMVSSLVVTGASLATPADMKRGIWSGTIPVSSNLEADYPNMARISFDQANQKALTAVNGRLLKSALEEEDGFLVYEVEVIGQDRSVSEVTVDAGNGEVLKIKQESDWELDDD